MSIFEKEEQEEISRLLEARITILRLTAQASDTFDFIRRQS